MARPKVLVFQHVPFEPLGTLDPLLKGSGFRIRYVNFGREPDSRPKLDGYEALIILGGPMNSDQIDNYPNLITEVEIIREAVNRDMSVLGICLGAQLLAKALGGAVSRNEVREIGWYNVEMTEAGLSDPVLSTFATTQEVFQWHEDGITLPPGADLLASSPASGPSRPWVHLKPWVATHSRDGSIASRPVPANSTCRRASTKSPATPAAAPA